MAVTKEELDSLIDQARTAYSGGDHATALKKVNEARLVLVGLPIGADKGGGNITARMKFDYAEALDQFEKSVRREQQEAAADAIGAGGFAIMNYQHTPPGGCSDLDLR